MFLYVMYQSKKERRDHRRSGSTEPFEFDIMSRMMGIAKFVVYAPEILKYLPSLMIVLYILFH